MRKAIPAALLILSMSHPALAADPYRVLRSVRIGGEGGFDYVTADSTGRRLYIARSGKTNPRLLAFDASTASSRPARSTASAPMARWSIRYRITALPAA